MSIMRNRRNPTIERRTMRLGPHPLYAQVRDVFVKRLVDGVWAPGEGLPSEIELAGELDVSQGTVRKALASMAADKLLVRQQGRGTFVAIHDEARILFQFFKLAPDAGEAAFPESRIVATQTEKASEAERHNLGLRAGARVIRIRRVRSLAGKTAIAERIALPASLFPRLTQGEIPNNLYGLYATRYGLAIARAEEKLKAVALDAGDAALLGVKPGTPALHIDRLARSLSGRPVEWRVSLCLTQEFHYLSELD
ncbi:GntR family transcriptional regulator [Rhizobiales bacterium GAS191]|jgi:GntR family transcriptional regulator|nr:GntR family transcriptional regulator [Rhizobiales bacterium GAS113]SEB88634.1 GntR family transcriptional regulator [Rhizobiales bacterium GAS191]SED28983.1 GntR family transcriptional regulator [Rhizobiales bacterium GAS188]